MPTRIRMGLDRRTDYSGPSHKYRSGGDKRSACPIVLGDLKEAELRMRAVAYLVAAAVPLLAIGASAGEHVSTRAVEAGRRFTLRSCAGCHAVGPSGSSPNAHAPPFRTLAERLRGPALDAQLAAISRYGHVEMPPIYMTRDEIRGVAAYIRSVRAGRRA